MSSIYGKNIKISIFGQSHSPAIGITIDGLPAGFHIDFNELNLFMRRRMPGQGAHATKRSEADKPEFLSGLVDGITCGSPLTAIIRNTDARSSDYEQVLDIPRPSHADYTSYIKYGEWRDVRGGGSFSGRLTAPLCVAGGICLQLLRRKGINIAAHIAQIGNITELSNDPSLPSEKMLAAIEKARQDGDSLGGIVECIAEGVPAGIGNPMFGGMENRIAAIIFGIPAVKGIEFGNGFAAAGLSGSQNNDSFYMDEGAVRTKTNNHGGILGGITSGMPIVFRVAFKPTPSIAKEQQSVSLSAKKDTPLVIQGRHDPCIVPRAVPCVEAAAAIALYDALLEPQRRI
jgi:chorismate synthase